MSSITAHPLCWPAARPRTPDWQRAPAKFRGTETFRYSSGHAGRRPRPLTIAEAKARILSELHRFGATSCVISSNLILNLDGSPRSSQAEPADPGVALYFRIDGVDHAMACDAWDRAADNMAAIAAHIDAVRRQLRYGVLDARDAFRGFAALPAPAEDWRAVLGLDERITYRLEDVEEIYKRLRSIYHPDRQGSAAQFDRVQRAIIAARAHYAR